MMNESPLISIQIPIYNQRDYIKDAPYRIF